MKAFLPLDAEIVLSCADCGALSSDDIGGSSRWALRRRGALRLLDICPACAPKAPLQILAGSEKPRL